MTKREERRKEWENFGAGRSREMVSRGRQMCSEYNAQTRHSNDTDRKVYNKEHDIDIYVYI